MNTVIHIILTASQTLWNLVPYVVIGAIIGEGLRFTKWTELIVKGMTSSPLLSILFAIILGIVSPLCTYGTIPVVLQLYRAGMPIAPLLAFLTASSMMNPQLFIMTWGGISLEFAVVRVGIVVLFGALIGLICYMVPSSWIVNKKILEQRYPETKESCCSQITFSWRRYIKHIIKSIEFVGFNIVIGVVLGSMVEVLVPGQVTQYLFKAGNLQAILLSSIISIPMYVCGGGAVPFVHSLIESGMSKGAAVAFFNVGSVTRAQTVVALATIIRPLYLVIYILILIGFSLTIGIIYH